MNLDFIIAGQGLAGSILAYRLLKRGYKIRIFDDGDNTASSVAAGLFNPITGKRWVKTWKAEEAFASLEEFYPALQESYQTEFYHPKTLYRLFTSRKEQNEWNAKSQNELSSIFIDRVVNEPQLPGILNDPYGGLLIRRAGFLNVPVLLNMMKQDFIARNILIGERIDENQLQFEPGKIRYRDYHAGYLIFCTGISALKSKYFSWLPFNPVKGEVLTVKADMKTDYIIGKGIFIIPEGNNQFKLGATYDRGNMDLSVTREAEIELLNKFRKIINTRVEVIHHDSGIRPATRDRRPFMGFHPDIKNLGIFNGFGSKGVSLIPYLSALYMDCLSGKVNLKPEINIMRYFN